MLQPWSELSEQNSYKHTSLPQVTGLNVAVKSFEVHDTDVRKKKKVFLTNFYIVKLFTVVINSFVII
jgi:hypothetical protein